MRINSQNNQNFKGLSKLSAPLGVFYNANAALPTLLIETGVTLGRSYEANKRGGKIEATERFVEQGVSALVWLYGVQFLKNIGEKLGKKFLKLENLDFDIGYDALRNPILNNAIDKKTATFKMANLLGATGIATLFIGFCLPKITHAITNSIIKKDKEKEQKTTLLKVPNLEEFKNQNKKTKGISFTSSFLNSFAHTIENNSAARLFITDSGVIAGRYKNGRNKYEKIEGLFRDIASIYFYLLATTHTTKALNKLTKNTDINPRAIEEITKKIGEKINSGISKENLINSLKTNISKQDEEKLKELFKDSKVITLEKFLEVFENKKDKALLMSELQPIFNDKRFLSYSQAQDVLSESLISDPKFLKETMEKITDGKSSEKLKFVSMGFLEKQRKSIDKYIEQLISQLKDETITKEQIEAIGKKTIGKNFLYYSIGTAFSAFALGILIPKVQYFITKKLTNENKFPGLQEYK